MSVMIVWLEYVYLTSPCGAGSTTLRRCTSAPWSRSKDLCSDLLAGGWDTGPGRRGAMGREREEEGEGGVEKRKIHICCHIPAQCRHTISLLTSRSACQSWKWWRLAHTTCEHLENCTLVPPPVERVYPPTINLSPTRSPPIHDLVCPQSVRNIANTLSCACQLH